MKLHTLKSNSGAKHRIKRLGCGESSGHGKTSGKGHKGQKARSGGGVRIGFEGGQMPLYRRLPKRGFSNARFKTVYAIVNLRQLEVSFSEGEEISEALLREKGLIKGRFDAVKILGQGTLSKKLMINGVEFSASAKARIEELGGKVLEKESVEKNLA